LKNIREVVKKRGNHGRKHGGKHGRKHGRKRGGINKL
tara:strand:- start:278 stop:388 length:111 start_codon:yes stop_codon:yes gene_type:complete